MYLPSEKIQYFLNQQQDRKRKLIVNAGRRSGKSIWTLLSIAKEYLPKEQYQKLVEDIEAELKPMGERQKIAVMEIDDLDNWKSADEVFGGNKWKSLY